MHAFDLLAHSIEISLLHFVCSFIFFIHPFAL